MSSKKMNIVIMHGKSNVWKDVKNLVNRLGYTSRVLKEEYTGEIIFEKMRRIIWKDIHCCLIILSADDVTRQNRYRARQNVVFELGYCFGAFDSIPSRYSYNSVIVLMENKVESFTDINGLEFIEFKKDKISDKFTEIEKILQKAYIGAKKYYEF